MVETIRWTDRHQLMKTRSNFAYLLSDLVWNYQARRLDAVLVFCGGGNGQKEKAQTYSDILKLLCGRQLGGKVQVHEMTHMMQDIAGGYQRC